MPETFRVGLLGHGTVGSAFARLLGERADAIVPVTGLRPELAGVLTRSRGDFEEILERLGPDRRADGRARPGARLRAARDARRAPRRLGEQAAAGRARRGAVGDGARARRAAALRGRGGRRRAGDPRAPGVARRRPRRARARDRQRHDQLHPVRDGARRALLRARRSARPSSSATPRPTRPRTSPARTPRPRWRSSRGSRSRTPVHLDQVVYEGIEHLTSDDLAYAQGARAGAEADRHGRARRRRHQRARASGVPVRGAPARLGRRPVQRGHRRVRGDHRDHAVGPGRRRPADRLGRAGRRDLGHDPARHDAGDDRGAAVVEDVVSAFYLHMEVADRPGVLAQIAELLGMQGARSSRSSSAGWATTRGW